MLEPPLCVSGLGRLELDDEDQEADPVEVGVPVPALAARASRRCRAVYRKGRTELAPIDPPAWAGKVQSTLLTKACPLLQRK